jgi:hypothetical protein
LQLFRTVAQRATISAQGCESPIKKKRAVIAFAVDAQCVSILGALYGGQDFETILQDGPEEGHQH